MSTNDQDKTRDFWNRIADDWYVQVGDDGDSNRILNSDPVLWELAGEVAGLNVLDAGCGTGYLSRKLHELGAHVTGIDFSERMCEIASAKNPGIEFRVDSCSELMTVADGSLDMVIANYVLMDLSDLEGAINAFSRVLKTGGVAVIVFSHPCFPQGRARACTRDGAIEYVWDFPYFEQRRCVDPPWGHFKAEFIWFHRPLSAYWKAFLRAGFDVEDFEEPRLTEERFHLAENQKKLNASKSRPYSVAFKLRKVRSAPVRNDHET